MRGCQRRMVVAFWLLAVRAVVRNSPFLTSITENKSRLRPRLTTLQGSDETNCFVAALFVWGCLREQTRLLSASPLPLSALLPVPIGLTPTPLGLTPNPSPRGEGSGMPCLFPLVNSSTRQLVNLFSTRSHVYFSAG